jgi:hypothetical protein
VNRGIPVFTDLPAYRVAVASLPLRARIADSATGAIVVIDGSTGWGDAATAAVEAGASAVLVAEPRDCPPQPLVELLERWPMAIVVHRSRLRCDVVERARTHRGDDLPRIVVADCRSDPDGLISMVRDAVGWTRELSKAAVRLGEAAVGQRGGTALLRADTGSVVGSMTVTPTGPEGEILRITALGETVTEVELDKPMGSFELATSTSEGRLVAPAPVEAGERVALRRALDAVVGRSQPSDLNNLLLDDTVARSVFNTGRSTALVDL